MDYLIREYGLQKGDKVSRMKRGTGLPVIRHYAVYLGVNQYNEHTFAENNVNHGVRIVTSDEFFRDSTSVKVESICKTNQQRERAVQFANQKIGHKYDLVNYNCEHFANEATTGRSISKQVIGWGMSALFVLVGGIFLKKIKNNNG